MLSLFWDVVEKNPWWWLRSPGNNSNNAANVNNNGYVNDNGNNVDNNNNVVRPDLYYFARNDIQVNMVCAQMQRNHIPFPCYVMGKIDAAGMRNGISFPNVDER